jgi:hypothetical protein
MVQFIQYTFFDNVITLVEKETIIKKYNFILDQIDIAVPYFVAASPYFSGHTCKKVKENTTLPNSQCCGLAYPDPGSEMGKNSRSGSRIRDEQCSLNIPDHIS